MIEFPCTAYKDEDGYLGIYPGTEEEFVTERAAECGLSEDVIRDRFTIEQDTLYLELEHIKGIYYFPITLGSPSPDNIGKDVDSIWMRSNYSKEDVCAEFERVSQLPGLDLLTGMFGENNEWFMSFDLYKRFLEYGADIVMDNLSGPLSKSIKINPTVFSIIVMEIVKVGFPDLQYHRASIRSADLFSRVIGYGKHK